MPPKFVKTIGDELMYEYAKLISRSALGKVSYGFVTDRYKALREGSASVSGTLREWQREQEIPKECVFCGSSENLEADHLIPKSRGGEDSADNLVLSCRTCNASRGDKGVFAWLGLKRKDQLHRLVAGKYLKLLLDLHEERETLSVSARNLDVELCPFCHNGPTCEEWGTVKKLTCFCLESVF